MGDLAREANGSNAPIKTPLFGLRHAKVVSTQSDGTCTISLAGVNIAGIKCIGGTSVNATVMVTQNGTDLVVIGQPVGRVGVAVTRVANQSIANTTLSSIQWDTEISDIQGFIAVPTNTFVVPDGMDGIYIAGLTVAWAGNPAAQNGLNISMNGEQWGSGVYVPGFNQNAQVTTGPLVMLAGYTMICSVYQSSGGNMNMTAKFWAYRISG